MKHELRSLLFVVALGGCGARSALDLLEDSAPDPIGSGGTVSARGGSTSTAGSSMGSTAGTPSTAGGPSAGGFGGFGGSVPVGGSGGTSGSGGAVGGNDAGGQPAEGGAGGAPPDEDPPLAVTLGLGAFISCAGFDDGSLRCWGHAPYAGHPGADTIGDNEPAYVGGDVDIGGEVVQLASTWYHTCALLETGKLRCWGINTGGRLGYGNTETIGDNETPAWPGDVDMGGVVTHVSTGPFHTCASLEDGSVRCWGANENHKLGYPDPALIIGDDETPAEVAPVDVGGFAVQVAAGYAHSCALLDTGKVRCWGSGALLGHPGVDTIGDDETPAEAGDVDLGGDAVQIVAGIYHTCALLDTGAVRCWGYAYDGALGYGNTEDIGDGETPADAGDVDVGGPVAQITAGDYGTCALLTTGTVRCWGSNEEGHLGYGHLEVVGDDETPAEAGDVDVGGLVSSIDMGFWHTCATLQSGKVRCWGRAGTGELGYGNTNTIGDNEAPSTAGDVPTHVTP